MSLQRVSSLEAFITYPADRWSWTVGDGQTRTHKLTFNPLPEAWDPESTTGRPQTVGAFDVPWWRRLLQVIAAVISCLLAAGIVFGYAALKPVLKAEGAYHQQCAAPNGSIEDAETCVEMRLNAMFTIAAVATNVVALPVGAILDHYGPRVCGLLGSLFLAAGALLMAFESRLSIDGLMLGYLCLALGGPFTFISSFQLSNAFPKHSGLILALLTGAFDASSVVFAIFRFIYLATDGVFTRRSFFLAYLIVPVMIALLQLTLMPARSYMTAGELVDDAEGANIRQFPSAFERDEVTPLLRERQLQQHARVVEGVEDVLGTEELDRQVEHEAATNKASGVWGSMHPRPASQQIRSFWFLMICMFTVVQMTRINFFVSTIRAQYNFLLDSADLARLVNTFFDVALPLGGILAIPVTGAVLDRASTPAVATALAAGAAAVGILGLIPRSLLAAYAHIVLFVLFRPFYYAAVQDLCAKVFGFKTFGRVYGAVICLAGLFNLSQSGWDYLFEKTQEGDPTLVNLFFLVVGLVSGVLLAAYTWCEARWWVDGGSEQWWDVLLRRSRQRRESAGSAGSAEREGRLQRRARRVRILR